MGVLVEHLLSIKSLVVMLAIITFFVAERVWPQAPLISSLSSGRAQILRWLKNYGFFGLNTLFGALVVIAITEWAAENALLWRQQWLGYEANNLWWIILDLLILDMALYWWHRINHVLPFLWRFHQVHHLDEFLDTSSAVRFHVGEVFLSALFRMAIILLIGIPLQSVIMFEILLWVSTLFHHSNWRIGQRIEHYLDWVIITPARHWVHHHARQSDTDSNYGTVLSVWDRLFRSRSETQRSDDMKIGVEGHRDLSFAKLLWAPLKKLKQRPKE